MKFVLVFLLMCYAAASAQQLTRDEQGPHYHYSNAHNPNYLEFSKSGFVQRGAIGALGSFEMNMSVNMDYRDNTHRLYDKNLPANWLALATNGLFLQYAPATNTTGDVWTTGGSLINFSVNNYGDGYFRGSSIIISTPSTPAPNEICAKGTIMWDANAIYVCVEQNTVKRAPLVF